jgi:hypothetical protein
MANGRQIAAANIAKFEAWVAERKSAGDWSDYIRGAQLNRTEIANECGFAKSVLRQNPSVKAALDSLEAELRNSGTLALLKSELPPQDVLGGLESVVERRINSINDRLEKRVKVLEEQNAALRAELMELREKTKRYALIEKHLTETGRMVRP